MNGSYVGYRLIQWFGSYLPAKDSAKLAERAAGWQWQRAVTDRKTVAANLSVILKRPVDAQDPLVRDVFRNFSRYLLEFLVAHRRRRPEIIIEGGERLAAKLPAGKGSMLLSGHMGNWEFGAIAMSRLGLSVSVVALVHRDPHVNAFFDAQRRRCGVGVIPLGAGAASQSVAWLRAGHVLGVLGDVEFGANGIAVSFCGHMITVPRGPAILSLRTGVPAVPVFVVREGPWRLRFFVEEPIWPPQGRWTAHQVQELTQRYTRSLERHVQRFPTQWMMFRPRFEPARPDRAETSQGAGVHGN